MFVTKYFVMKLIRDITVFLITYTCYSATVVTIQIMLHIYFKYY
jgi:hypothetical protein